MGYYVTFDGGSGTGKGVVIAWCAKKLAQKGKSVLVLRDNQLDDLREYGAVMIEWCKMLDVEHQSFLLPLIACGHARSDKAILELLPNYDFVLRDRSFISSLAYQAATDAFTPEQIWDLHVRHLGLRIPDVSVIVDADVEVAQERMAQRTKQDIGLGGKMSGGLERRRNIHELFRTFPERFCGKMDMLLVQNNAPYTEDSVLLERRIAQACGAILKHFRAKRMLS